MLGAKRLAPIILGGVFMMGAAQAASPWGQPVGKDISITTLEAYYSSDTNRSFGQVALESYAEFGLIENWSLTGKLAQGWQRVEVNDLVDNRNGIIDAEIGLQRQLGKSDFGASAAKLTYSFGTSTRSAFFGADGDGTDPSMELAYLWGRGNEIAYFAGEIGYRASLGDDADQLRADATIGYHASEDVLFLLKLLSRQKVSDPTENGLGYSLTTARASLVFDLSERQKIELGGRLDIAATGLDAGGGAFISYWVTP